MSETTNLHLKKHDNVTTNENPFDIENYLNGNWDKIDTGYGTILTDYVKNTDYARNNKGGVVKVQPTVYGLGIDGNGFLSPQPIDYNAYLSKTNFYNIDKGTLENVITGKGLANNTQIQELQQENEKLKKALPQIKGTGTDITLNNTSDNKFNDLVVEGNTEQDTLTGKNLCTEVDLQSSENIRFYFNKKLLEKTFTISFIPNEALNNTLYLDKSNGIIAVGSISGSANTKVSKTITLTDEAFENLQSATWFNFRLYKSGANFTVPTEAMIQNGSTATDFEPYCGRYSSTKSTVMNVLLKMLQVM